MRVLFQYELEAVRRHPPGWYASASCPFRIGQFDTLPSERVGPSEHRPSARGPGSIREIVIRGPFVHVDAFVDEIEVE